MGRIPAVSMTIPRWRKLANAIDKVLTTKEVKVLSASESRLLGHFTSELKRDLKIE